MPNPRTLQRHVGLTGATVLGLGSILGSGVFISLGLGTNVAGAWVIPAVLLAGALAACNGLSSAQLAAAHPVAGGTYAYGQRFLNPTLGAVAGFCFLLAKSASAATAALGLAGYLIQLLAPSWSAYRVPIALAMVGGVTALVLAGIRRTNTINLIAVAITLISLLLFVVIATPSIDTQNLALPDFNLANLLHATALLFVAYTGYGRVATLGEEIINPARNIPIAIIITLAITTAVYLSVTLAAVGTAGATSFAHATLSDAAPLQVIADHVLQQPLLAVVVTIGAATAMLGVLLNLLLGLSRVAMAMGRGGDLPGGLAHLNAAGTTPGPAVILVALIVSALVCFGSVATTWSLAAVTVLLYYSLTNLAALRLPREHRRYPRVLAYMGLLGCLGLCLFIEPVYLIAALTFAILTAIVSRQRRRRTV